jgi:hypothetical protein
MFSVLNEKINIQWDSGFPFVSWRLNPSVIPSTTETGKFFMEKTEKSMMGKRESQF